MTRRGVLNATRHSILEKYMTLILARPYGEKASLSSSTTTTTSLLLSPSLIYFNLSCFTFPLREHAFWWAAPYRPRNCVCALAVMKHLDAGESDGCTLIQVVVLPMQASAPSSRLGLHLQTACLVFQVRQFFFFLRRGQGLSSGAWWWCLLTSDKIIMAQWSEGPGPTSISILMLIEIANSVKLSLMVMMLIGADRNDWLNWIYTLCVIC